MPPFINEPQPQHMATAAYLNSPMRTVKGQQVVNTLKPVIRVNRTQIISHGSVAAIAGPGCMAAPITSITYLITNATAGVLTYVIGDPNLLVAGAHGAVWTQPTGVRNGSVAGVQGSFSSSPETSAQLLDRYALHPAPHKGSSFWAGA